MCAAAVRLGFQATLGVYQLLQAECCPTVGRARWSRDGVKLGLSAKTESALPPKKNYLKIIGHDQKHGLAGVKYWPTEDESANEEMDVSFVNACRPTRQTPARNPRNKNHKKSQRTMESHLFFCYRSLFELRKQQWLCHRIHCFVSEPNFMGRQRQRHLGRIMRCK